MLSLELRRSTMPLPPSLCFYLFEHFVGRVRDAKVASFLYRYLSLFSLSLLVRFRSLLVEAATPVFSVWSLSISLPLASLCRSRNPVSGDDRRLNRETPTSWTCSVVPPAVLHGLTRFLVLCSRGSCRLPWRRTVPSHSCCYRRHDSGSGSLFTCCLLVWNASGHTIIPTLATAVTFSFEWPGVTASVKVCGRGVDGPKRTNSANRKNERKEKLGRRKIGWENVRLY